MKSIIKRLLREALNKSKFLFKEQSEIESCECCKYFDMNSTNRYEGLENPLYFIFDKGEMTQVKYIEPKQYIYAVARGFGVSYDDALSHVNYDNVKTYVEDMKKGDKFPIGYYKDGEKSQEGRHRAMALMSIGCNKMPVVVIRNLNKDEIVKLALTFKNKSKEELDSMFKKMGYNGVTDLDIRSLKNYIEYKL
jgi:hypothetical protein